MSELEFKMQPVVWQRDLEDFLESIYGKRPDIQAGEWGQETHFEFEVKDHETVEGFDLEAAVSEEIKDWGERHQYVDWEVIGLDLARKKLIPEAKYLVNIWW